MPSAGTSKRAESVLEELKTWTKEQFVYPFTFTTRSISQLTIDAIDGPEGKTLKQNARLAYQRVQDGVVQKIVKNGLQMRLLLPLIVNHRPDTTQRIILDGGGRFRAIRWLISEGVLSKDFPIPVLECSVPVADEAMLFIDLNKEKLGIKKPDYFIAAVAANDPDYVRMDETIRSVTKKKVGNGKGDIQSVDAIETIYFRKTVERMGDGSMREIQTGKQDLFRTMRLLMESGWVYEEKGLGGGNIAALGKIVSLHNAEHTDDYLIMAMRQTTPLAVHELGQMYSPGGGGSRSRGVGSGYVLAEKINKYHKVRKGSKKWIDPEQFLTEASREMLAIRRAA